MRHLFRQREPWLSIFAIGLGRIYNTAVGHPNGGASAARGAQSNTSATKQVRMSDISVAVQLLARLLEVNCQYSIFA